jgi:hypothetical protein
VNESGFNLNICKIREKILIWPSKISFL